MGSETLRFIIQAKDEASRTLHGVGGSFGSLGKMGVAAAAAIASALVGAGLAVLKLGAEFDAAYDTIRIGTGKTGAALAGLQDDFKAVVKAVPANFADAGKAVADLNTRLGLSGAPLREMTERFLELSRLTGTDVAGNIRLGTRLFGDWSIAADRQTDALDKLFRATQVSGIGLGELMQTVVQFGAPLRNLGFDFDSSIAMLSKWEREGVNITTVLAGMRFALKRFAAEGIDPSRGLAKAIDDIAKAKSRAAAMKIGGDIFGLRGASDVVAAIREGRFQYDAFLKSIRDGHDTITQAAKDTEDYQESLTKMWSSLKVRAEPALTAFFKGVSDIMAGRMPGDEEFFAGTALGLQKATAKMTADMTTQWGQAAARTRYILEDLRRLMADPLVLGDINAKHTQSELRGIRDGIMRQLHITKTEANQIMSTLFDDWKGPKKPPGVESIEQVEGRLKKMRAQLARNLAFGKLDNKSLLKKIAEAEAKRRELQARFRVKLATGHLNTSGWLSGISQATTAYQVFRSLVTAPIIGGRITMQPISAHDGGGQHGGTFRGPESGYYTLMHGIETIVAHNDPTRGLRELARYGLLPQVSVTSGGSAPSAVSGGTVHNWYGDIVIPGYDRDPQEIVDELERRARRRAV